MVLLDQGSKRGGLSLVGQVGSCALFLSGRGLGLLVTMVKGLTTLDDVGVGLQGRSTAHTLMVKELAGRHLRSNLLLLQKGGNYCSHGGGTLGWCV